MNFYTAVFVWVLCLCLSELAMVQMRGRGRERRGRQGGSRYNRASRSSRNQRRRLTTEANAGSDHGDTARADDSVNTLSAPYSGEHIRLRGNSSFFNAGLLEVYRNHTWGLVCDDMWGVTDAAVACRQLGFTRGAEQAVRESFFGTGSYDTSQFVMDDMACDGDENTLQACEYSLEHDCDLTETAGVACRLNTGCEDGWTSGQDSCYRLFRGQVSFITAKNRCERLDSHLVRVETIAENNFLSNMLRLIEPNEVTWYTGGKKVAGQWLWEDNRELISDTKWFPGWVPSGELAQPSNRWQESCLALQSRFPRPDIAGDVNYHFWNDVRCSILTNFICEKDKLNSQNQDDCYNGRGEDYRGTASQTDRDTHCAAWIDSPSINPRTHPNQGLEGNNFCRNPDSDSRPWCWVNIAESKFGFCRLRQCSSNSSTEGHATETTTAATVSTPVPACPSNKFFCNTQQRCIPASWRCDGEADCDTGEDEQECDYQLPLYTRYPNKTISATHEKERYIRIVIELCARKCVEARGYVCRSFSFKRGKNECFLSEDNTVTVGRPVTSFLYDYYELTSQTISCSESGMFQCNNGKCIEQIEECDGVDNCNDFSDEVNCGTPSPVEVRLVNGEEEHSGRVEVKYLGEWGIVCDDEWGQPDAAVVCKMLGYRGAVRATTQAEFGPGNGNILLSNVACEGDEARLEDCPHDPWRQHLCQPHEAAGVVCQGFKVCQSNQIECTSGECFPASYICDGDNDCGDNSDEQNCEPVIELVDGSFPNQGRVEITRNGVRGTVCDDGWDGNDAGVVCRLLGYSDGVPRSFGSGTGMIWLDNVECSGTETSLQDCLVDTWGTHACDHEEDAGVVCFSGPVVTDSSVPVIAPSPSARVQCGNRRVSSVGQNRIMGGYSTTPGAIPWQATIRQIRENWQYVPTKNWCGATIISDYWILSAAHCFEDNPKSSYRVRVGDMDNKSPDLYEQEFTIDKLIPHQLYTRISHDYDIALIKVRPNNGRGILFNDYVQPACLPQNEDEYISGTVCHISGWGRAETGYPNMLKAADVPLISRSTCQLLYKGEITPRMFCAGYVSGGVDTCQGDSGGPLVCDIEGSYTILGVTSWGRGCGLSNSPGVYTKVYEYLPWIRSTMRR